MRALRRGGRDLLQAIKTYAYGPGETALTFLEGLGPQPPTVTAEDVFNCAWHNGFDLAMAVKALRDSHAQESNEQRS